jgi:3-phosphoshikimate 1-carboxyvinyltransferase
VKEADRIAGLVEGLRTVGADVEEFADGFAIRGPTTLRGGACDARQDHRLAMAFSLVQLVAHEPVTIAGMRFVRDSFPGFARLLGALR